MPRPFLLASFVAMLAASIATVFGASVPAISEATGVRSSTVGQLTSVLSLGGFVPLVLWRRQLRRRRTDRLVAGALALLSVGAALVAVNPAATRQPAGVGSLWALAATVLVVGFAFGWTQVGVSTVVANRGASARILNALHGTYGLGAVMLPLVAARTDLRTVAWGVSVLAAVAVPGLLRAPDLRDEARSGRRREAMRARPRTPRRLWHGDGSRPWVWMFSVAIGVEIGTLAWAATHLVSRGETEQVAAAAVSGYFALFATSRFVLAAVVDRLDLRRVVVAANGLAAIAAAAAAVVPLPVVAWVLVGVGVGPVFPTTLAWSARVTGDADVTRKLMYGGALGAIVLPASIGLLAGVVGPVAIPWSVALIGVAAAVLAATLPATDGRRPDATGAAPSTPT